MPLNAAMTIFKMSAPAAVIFVFVFLDSFDGRRDSVSSVSSWEVDELEVTNSRDWLSLG